MLPLAACKLNKLALTACTVADAAANTTTVQFYSNTTFRHTNDWVTSVCPGECLEQSERAALRCRGSCLSLSLDCITRLLVCLQRG